LILARRIAGPEEAPGLVDETTRWIERALPAGYAWPGNVRELEQCVRSILVRGEYIPVDRPAQPVTLAESLEAGDLTADALVALYCSQVYAQTGSYEETGRRLGLDRRTVKAKVQSHAGS